MKKIVLVIMVLSVLATMGVSGVQAAAWYTCTVNQTGVSPTNSMVMLTQTSNVFANRWFVLPAAQGNQMLAVALTAMSSGMHVSVYTNTTQYSVIGTMYLVP
ncbi:MAG: hypothetical protein C4567_07200 [Deltaproteobacteria bacterium]|nr:MAG: hypothetical protein C4567_07200 [Deltaproteobacteria bacterium]